MGNQYVTIDGRRSNVLIGEQSFAMPPPTPMVQDILQKLNSIGADFIWLFAIYQEQMRINKELKGEITNVTASHELLRQTCDLAEHKITSLESLLFKSDGDDASDSDTEFFSGSSTEEGMEDLHEEASHLKAEIRRLQLAHETEMVEMAQVHRNYEEALNRATELIAADTKKIAELEARHESRVVDQNCDSIKSEHREA